MKNHTTLAFIGSLLILIGTAIGAGMLALPLISAQAGFTHAIILLTAIWILMTITGLLVLEVNLAFKARRNNFDSMAKGTLGKPGQIIAWLACLLLLYALTAAYISGNASLVDELTQHVLHHPISNWVNAILFTIVFGGAVFWSTRTVDLLNRWLMSVKGITLIIMLILLMPHVHWTQLMSQPGHTHYLWAAAPIFLTAFGFHTSIPSLSNYLGPQVKKLKWIVIIGATVPFVIYILWLVCSLGIIPMLGSQSFHMIEQQGNSVGGFVLTLNNIVHSHWVSVGVNTFSNIAMTTSFLGVTLGLFDFLADALKRSNDRFGRFQTALITFVPPLIFALLYPKGFIMALGYAAVCVAVLEVIMPALMAYQLRRHKKLKSPYRVFGGTPLLVIVEICGVLLIIAQFWNSIH